MRKGKRTHEEELGMRLDDPNKPNAQAKVPCFGNYQYPTCYNRQKSSLMDGFLLSDAL